ncbi:MAG: hypothetical protein D6819_09870 [Gammaproteobacteria bacterium]|nr:MAG: hypothetical protein D6819_09870 [Gammaproteobacteria bacterium]
MHKLLAIFAAAGIILWAAPSLAFLGASGVVAGKSLLEKIVSMVGKGARQIPHFSPQEIRAISEALVKHPETARPLISQLPKSQQAELLLQMAKVNGLKALQLKKQFMEGRISVDDFIARYLKGSSAGAASRAATVATAAQKGELGEKIVEETLKHRGLTLLPARINGKRQGIDHIAVRASQDPKEKWHLEEAWIVETKTGTSQLTKGQMSRAWLERHLENLMSIYAVDPHGPLYKETYKAFIGHSDKLKTAVARVDLNAKQVIFKEIIPESTSARYTGQFLHP